MAAWTDGEILASTLVEANSGRLLDVAEGGQIRGRNTFDETVFIINFEIKIDVTERADIDTFYTDYSDVWNTVTIDGINYSWLFETQPVVESKDGDIRYMAFRAVGYKV